MANNNPHYNAWIFRRPGAALARLQDDEPDDTPPPTPTDFQRVMAQRRRLEILSEARLLKAHLNDLW